MIAERSGSPVQEQELSLFEGLRFPEVPRHAIRVASAPPAAEVHAEEDNETTSLLATTASNKVTEDIPVRKEEKRTRTGNLSTLYANEVITNELHTSTTSSYPNLPPITRESTSSRVTEAITPTVMTHHSTMIHPRTEVAERAPQTTENPTSTLVDELLRENSRLSDEVTRLQSLLARSQSQSGSSTITPETSQAAILGVSISHPNAPPRQGVKYVCCGACRQWLLVDKDAMLVACANCDAVNNCNLVQPRNASTPGLQQMEIDNSHEDNNQTSNSWFPGVTECFSRMFH